MAEKSSLIFISGGVRSGKSSFAERVAANIAEKTAGKLHYIAAGQSSDPEMKERISRHQKDREESGLGWKTWEHPVGLNRLSNAFGSNDIVLLDCLTTLLNNEFFKEDEQWRDLGFQDRIMNSVIEGIEQITNECHTFIVVSNEVLNEPIGDNELVFTYGKMLGRLHQHMASFAMQAYLIEAGIPMLMKGAE